MRNFNDIAIIGDWHGDTGWAIRVLKALHVAGITEAIQVGDFGVWPGQEAAVFIRKVNAYCERFGITLYVTPGNHEDYTRIEDVPVGEDGWQHYRENILLTPRAHRWVWNDVSFVSLGGANSIDRESRTPFINWWEGEQITLGDVYRTVEGGHADVMITHECPSGALPVSSGEKWSMFGLNYARESSDMIRHAVDSVKPDILFHGHYHTFADTNVVFNDGIQDYTTRVVGLDMNGHDNNVAVFNTETRTYNILPV